MPGTRWPASTWSSARATGSSTQASGSDRFERVGVSASLLDELYFCAYTLQVRWEWDPEKARQNLQKHGVDFADAVGALEDELALTIRDPFSETEERFVTMGMDTLGRLLVVVYTWRGQNVRLISARIATRAERCRYEEE